MVLYLNANEEKALLSLSEVSSYVLLPKKCTLPLAGVYPFVNELKRKTGIANTLNRKECAAYFTRYASAMEALPPSERQRWLLRSYLDCTSFSDMAAQLSTRHSEEPAWEASDMLPLMDSACEAVGIFTRDESQRRLQIRLYFSAFERTASFELSTMQEAILRKWTEGADVLTLATELGQFPRFVKDEIKQGARKLGLSVKGRDAQKNLVRCFFRFRDAQTVTMDDPMF